MKLIGDSISKDIIQRKVQSVHLHYSHKIRPFDDLLYMASYTSVPGTKLSGGNPRGLSSDKLCGDFL